MAENFSELRKKADIQDLGSKESSNQDETKKLTSKQIIIKITEFENKESKSSKNKAIC